MRITVRRSRKTERFSEPILIQSDLSQIEVYEPKSFKIAELLRSYGYTTTDDKGNPTPVSKDQQIIWVAFDKGVIGSFIFASDKIWSFHVIGRENLAEAIMICGKIMEEFGVKCVARLDRETKQDLQKKPEPVTSMTQPDPIKFFLSYLRGFVSMSVLIVYAYWIGPVISSYLAGLVKMTGVSVSPHIFFWPILVGLFAVIIPPWIESLDDLEGSD